MNEAKRRSWMTIAMVGALVAATAGAPQKTLSPDALYRRAVEKEKVDGDAQDAIDLYKQVAADPAASPKLKSQAQKQLTALEASARAVTERVICSGSCAGFRAGTSISADGRYIASTDENDALAIWDTMTGRVVRPAGAKQLTYGPWPLLSADGQQVVYNFVERDGNDRIVKHMLQIIRVDANARPRTLVDSSEYHDFIPGAWDPSNQKVLVAVAKPDDTWVLAWVSVKNGQVEPIKSLGWRFSPVMARPTLSPDGRYIAYSALAGAPARARSPMGSDSHIYVLPADHAGAEIELVTGASNNVSPAWMPDSRTVLFVSNRGGGEFGLWSASLPLKDGQATAPVLVKPGTRRVQPVGTTKSAYYYATNDARPAQFSIVDSRGRAPRALKRNAGVTVMGASPVWSPDGTRVAFRRPAPQLGGSQLFNALFVYVIGSDIERRYNIGPDAIADLGAPLWLHDNKTLIQPVYSQGEILLFRGDSSRDDIRGGEIARVEGNSRARLVLSSDDRAIYVLINGRRPSADVSTLNRILEINLDSGRVRDVATVSASEALRLSRDNKTLYLTSGCTPHCERIVAVDVTSGRETQLHKLPSPEFLYGASLALSPDGRMLAAVSSTPSTPEHPVLFQVFQIGIDGNGYRRLADIKRQPGSLSWSNDGTIVVASDSGLVRIPPGGGTPEIITAVSSQDVTVSPDGLHMAVATASDRVPVVRTIDSVSTLLKTLK